MTTETRTSSVRCLRTARGGRVLERAHGEVRVTSAHVVTTRRAKVARSRAQGSSEATPPSLARRCGSASSTTACTRGPSGGAERWMRDLAERLVADGHEVTYLTRRQWDEGDEPAIPGVRVVAVSRREELYGPDGNRTHRPAAALRLAACCATCCATARAYDAVHTCSFPYFSLLAARVGAGRHGRADRRRLVRGLVAARTGGATSAAPRGRDRLARAAAVRARDAAGVRVQPPARRAAARGGAARRARARSAGSTPGRSSRAPTAAVDGGRRSSCSPGATSPRSARRASRRRSLAARERRARRCAGSCSATGPSAPQVLDGDRARRRRRRRRGARVRRRRGGARRRSRARACLLLPSEPRGLRAGRDRGRRGRHAVGRGRGRGQRGGRAGRGGRQRLRGAARRTRRRSRRRSCAASRAARRCAPRRRRGSRSARRSCRSARRPSACWRSTAGDPRRRGAAGLVRDLPR